MVCDAASSLEHRKMGINARFSFRELSDISNVTQLIRGSAEAEGWIQVCCLYTPGRELIMGYSCGGARAGTKMQPASLSL